MTNTAPAATEAAIEAAINWADTNRESIEHQLFDLLRIPSVSTQPDHASDCRAAAEWLADDMERLGMAKVQLLETAGHPLVYGELMQAGSDAPTVLVYGHYDVQPPEPIEEWRTPPFEPTVIDGDVYGRGASDDKGQLFIHLKSLEACIAAGTAPPVNVKVILEGEEESGSEHLEDAIVRHRDLLAADCCLISDSHMLSATQPSLVASLRGMAYMQIDLEGPAHDLHSGTFGGGVRNPAEELARIIAALKDTDGRITVPGFYDPVVEPTAAERESLAAVPFSEADFAREAGVDRLHGEAGWTTYERVGARPTLEVNGMWSGYTGDGAKTVLPARASAKISMRLVADQRWRDVAAAFTAHVESLVPDGMRVTVTSLHGGEPSLVDVTEPAIRAASAALRRTWGTDAVFTREGGSIPVVTVFREVLDIDTVLMGFGLPDDRLHSPNEKFSLAQLHRGIATSIAFWHEYAAVDAG